MGSGVGGDLEVDVTVDSEIDRFEVGLRVVVYRKARWSRCRGEVGVVPRGQGCGELGRPNRFARFFNGRVAGTTEEKNRRRREYTVGRARADINRRDSARTR